MHACMRACNDTHENNNVHDTNNKYRYVHESKQRFVHLQIINVNKNMDFLLGEVLSIMLWVYDKTIIA